MLLVGACGIVPALFDVFGTTMRYLFDISPCLALAGMLVLWKARERASKWTRRSLDGLFVATAVATSAIGLLLGSTGYYSQFPNHNPELFARLQHWF